MPRSALTPELALEYLAELSTDIRSSILLDARGAVAACSDDDRAGRLGTLVLELFERADGLGEPVTQIEVSTRVGSVFALRDAQWTLTVVAGRFALPSLMFYDMRSVLSDLRARAA